MTEREVAARLNYEMQRGGASGPSFETIVASGARGSLPHGIASDKAVAEGELVVLDLGAMVAGYASDMTRTIMVGAPGPEERRVYDAVLAAHGAALEVLRPGVNAREVDRAARDLLAARGLADGEPARAWNDLGSVDFILHVTDRVPAGVVVAEGIWWLEFAPGARSVNALTSQRLTDQGGGSTFYDNRVDMRKEQ